VSEGDIAGRLGNEGKSRIDSCSVLLDLLESGELVEPGIDFDHAIFPGILCQVVNGSWLRVVIDKAYPGVIIPGTGSDFERHRMKIYWISVVWQREIKKTVGCADD
jgi:hypothetical protein